MAQRASGVGGVPFDVSKRSWPNEVNVLLALVIIVAAFEVLGRLFVGDSFLFNTRSDVGTLFNEQRLQVIVLQVSIVGIIAKPLPMGAVAMLGIVATVITGTLNITQALSGFGNNTIWLIVTAFLSYHDVLTRGELHRGIFCIK